MCIYISESYLHGRRTSLYRVSFGGKRGKDGAGQ